MTDRVEGRATGAPSRSSRVWLGVTAVELALAVTAVLVDQLLPTLVLLLLAMASLRLRGEGWATLGVCRPTAPRRMVLEVLALTAAWTVLALTLVEPVLEHLTGRRQDVGQFADLEGNLGLLLVLLALSWTLAAVGEEVAYRGYLLTRLRMLLPAGTASLGVAVLLGAVVFGLAHREQGVVGVALVTVDAIFFSVLRLHYRTLWASVLAHGLGNTFGLVAFYLVGPVYGLW